MKTGFICASGYNVVATATRNGRRLIAVILGAYSGAARSQKAAQLLENGFNNGGLSWLTPSLGTVDGLAPIDAQPANLRDEMCGPHRRKPPSEDNEEEEPAAATGDTNANSQPLSSQTFALTNAKPAKYVLGPAVDTTPPVVVFTGPADHPDTADQTASAPAKAKHKKKAAAKSDADKPATAKPPKSAKPAKTAKPKAAAAAQ